MSRRLPIIPTIVVAAAVAAMIGLGIWQLHRAKWKDAMLVQYARAEALPPIAWPTTPLSADQLPLFRHATGNCLKPVGQRTTVAENARGEPGYGIVVQCATGAEGPGMAVEVGWTKNPNARADWRGGLVSGVIAPDRINGMRLVAASAPAGLEPSRPPSPDTIPNNHRSYAVQWFGFALVATVIYVLALRRRRKETPAP